MLPNSDRLSKTNVWQRTIDLTNKVFKVTGGLDLPRGDYWLAVVTVGLDQANERLDSIRILLEKGYGESAVVLARSLFELVVNLTYISKDTKNRLPLYLRHGGIPITDEVVQQLRQQLTQGNLQAVIDFIPRQSWKTLKQMCDELGSNWLEEYETFYRYASVPNHYGSFTLGTHYRQLLEKKALPSFKKAMILIAALGSHLRVVEIAAGVFPEQIDSEAVNDLNSDYQQLEQFSVQCAIEEVGPQYLNTRWKRNP